MSEFKVELKLEEDKSLELLQVGQTLTPKEVDGKVVTGCAIVIKASETSIGTLYEIMTDFGNTFKFYDREVYSHYRTDGRVENIQERIQTQMDKLTQVWINIKDGEYNEQFKGE